MEPEETFLDNAATMIKYSRLELEQFLDWAGSRKVYGDRAKALVYKLETLATEMKTLQKEYKAR